jgi:hypothetical protein
MVDGKQQVLGTAGPSLGGMKWGGADQRPHRVRCLPQPVAPGIAAQYAAETEWDLINK